MENGVQQFSAPGTGLSRFRGVHRRRGWMRGPEPRGPESKTRTDRQASVGHRADRGHASTGPGSPALARRGASGGACPRLALFLPGRRRPGEQGRAIPDLRGPRHVHLLSRVPPPLNVVEEDFFALRSSVRVLDSAVGACPRLPSVRVLDSSESPSGSRATDASGGGCRRGDAVWPA